MKSTEFSKKLHQKTKYDSKTLPKLLKYLKKIRDLTQYEDYIRDNIKIPLIEWIIQVLIIRPVLFIAVLMSLSAFSSLPPPLVILILAEGLSILWYLLVELKQDLWRK